jgi:hypothetical protein
MSPLEKRRHRKAAAQGARVALSSMSVALAAVLLGHLVACTRSEPPLAGGIVRQVDHILIESGRAKELFSLLTETFGLPVAWPMSGYGSFASGGVAFGNVNLEVLDAPGSGVSARFAGFALEPAPLRAALSELESRGIPHGKAIPYGKRWTTVSLPAVSSEAVNVFFCEYRHDVPDRRRHLLSQLRAKGGASLSIHSVREIVYGTTDVQGMQARWQTLLNPLKPLSTGVWSIGDGPVLRVIHAEKEGVLGLVVNVESLEQARSFLVERNLLGSDRATELTILEARAQGMKYSSARGAAACRWRCDPNHETWAYRRRALQGPRTSTVGSRRPDQASTTDTEGIECDHPVCGTVVEVRGPVRGKHTTKIE